MAKALAKLGAQHLVVRLRHSPNHKRQSQLQSRDCQSPYVFTGIVVNRGTGPVWPKSQIMLGCLPFTPKFLQINSPPVFFLYFFCNFYGNSLRPPIFFVTPMRYSGSRVDWEIFFVSFTKLIPRKIFFCIAKILVLMVHKRGTHGGGVSKGAIAPQVAKWH